MRRALPPALFSLAALALLPFAGLTPLWFLGPLAQAGVLETGQIEPSRWLVAAFALLAALALVLGRGERRFWLPWAATGMAGMVLLLCMLAGVEQGAGVPAADRRAEDGARPVAGVLTGLPLFWDEGEAAPARQALRGVMRHELKPLDALEGGMLRPFARLLVAQPRALPPSGLVALDDWVRGGGKALILADPLLLWPTELPLGDARRPPATSLLDPLLTHWGLRLEPVAQGDEGLSRRLLPGGAALLLAGASRFSLLPGARCALEAGGLMARCRLGKGEARLVADADWIDDRLWLADPRYPQRPAAYAADAALLADHWLAAPLAPPPSARVRRVRDEAALVRATRAALLAGMLWAGLGAWLFSRRERTGETG